MTVAIADGVLTIAAGDYDAWFGGAGAVVLLREDAALCVIPVLHAAAGGSLVKIKNAARDRAIDVRELLRAHGDEARGVRDAHWDAARALLVVAEVFA